MKKIICITDCYPQHPRLEKLAEYYSRKDDYQVQYILWDREGACKSEKDNIHVFRMKAPYGDKVTKLLKLPSYTRFILGVLRKEDPDIIICRFWSVFFPLSLTYFRKCRLIYDVCDMPWQKYIRMLEKILVKRADTVVLSSRFFRPFYRHKDVAVLETRLKRDIVKNNTLKRADDEKLRLTFLGKVRFISTMKRLVDSVAGNSRVELKFYGDGPDLDELKSYCREIGGENIKLFGRFSQDQISDIYAESDLIWCAYPSHVFNVVYAMPNKYFESVAFRTPGIFSENTSVGEEVRKNNIGYTVDPYDTGKISELIDGIVRDRTSLDMLVQNLETYEDCFFWEDYFTD